MADMLKNAIKVGKMFRNGYLERDYAYLSKPEFIKSNNTNLRLNLVISCIDRSKMYGGLTTAINLFFYLCKVLDCDMRILVTEQQVIEDTMVQYPEFELVDADDECNKRKVVCNLQTMNGKRGQVSIRKKDIMMTTYWSTHYIISDVVKYQREKFNIESKIMYLIQDFEPGFYQWSSEYFLCESTYKTENVVAIFNSQNLKEYVEKQGYSFMESISFSPKLNETLLKHIDLLNKIEKKNQIIVYGRPKVPRNCFSIIVEALKKVTSSNINVRNWEFLSIGSSHRDVKLSNGCILKARGKLSLEEYAEILASSKVGISLMCSPHPSYPPLEMAAFGVKTITNSFYCKNLSGFSKNIISLDIVNFDSVANAVEEAIGSSVQGSAMTMGDQYLQTEDQFEEVGKLVKDIFSKI